ncbi:2TM domain-containing protein [Aquimarina litoralis]
MNCNIMETSELNKRYEYAKKRVKEERIFYTHLGVYLVINVIITAVILQFQEYIYDGYLVINLISSPVLWGVFLLAHGLWVFRDRKLTKNSFTLSLFSKKWEEKKIKELMNDTNQ